MSDLFSLALIGGFIYLLRKWGKYPEPAPQNKYRSYQRPRPAVRHPAYPRYEDDDEDED